MDQSVSYLPIFLSQSSRYSFKAEAVTIPTTPPTDISFVYLNEITGIRPVKSMARLTFR